MTKVENDTTRDPTPAIIIAGPHTGGTFLAHGLSNHPDVYCERQEVLHLGSSYRMIEAGLSSLDILKIVWGQTGYLVSACKLHTARRATVASGSTFRSARPASFTCAAVTSSDRP